MPGIAALVPADGAGLSGSDDSPSTFFLVSATRPRMQWLGARVCMSPTCWRAAIT